MENIEIILSGILAIIGFVISTVTYVVKFIQAKRQNKNFSDDLEIKDTLLKFITEAETFIQLNGEEKKQYVIENTKKFAENNGFECDESNLCAQIESIIAMTKLVNAKDKSEE